MYSVAYDGETLELNEQEVMQVLSEEECKQREPDKRVNCTVAEDTDYESEEVMDEEEVMEKLHRSDIESHGLVDVKSDMTRFDAERLHQLIQNHVHYTASTLAQSILDNWDDYLPKFVKVMPLEYRRALQEMQVEQTGEMNIGMRRG